jgi:hypothetical protein
MIVVILAMPSLLLFSRSSKYSFVRIGGTILALLASSGWITERVLNPSSVIDPLRARATHYAPELAGALFVPRLLSRLLRIVFWSPKFG